MTEYRSRDMDGYEQIVFCEDADTGLKCIIAIHNTVLGPALGGCRMWPYATDRDALNDALRLSRGMTYKAAVAGLPLGGGKAVIMADPRTDKTDALLKSFGQAVNQLRGRYITGEDVGISVDDAETIATQTQHIAGLTGRSGDPSPVTAYGVFVGLRTALKHRTGSENMAGLRVAVQGLGHVGYNLCKLLYHAGAELTVTDIAEDSVARVVHDFEAKAVSPDQIYRTDVDVFAPCALGATVNHDTVKQLKAGIIAGAANNQLADETVGIRLADRGILYAPDFVINAGGLINISWEVLYPNEPYDRAVVLRYVDLIEPTLTRILERSAANGRPPHDIAVAIAQERLDQARAA